MALSTYTELLAAAAHWLDDREDLTATIPDFVTLAEARISERLRVAEMETTASAVLVNGAVALPADFLEPRRIYSQGTGAYATGLRLLTPTQAGNEYPTSQSGVPVHYSISGNALTTHPSGGTGTVVMTYYARPPALAIYQTNWLLTKSPGVYLYGVLIEAAPFLHDDQRTETWATLFEDAIAKLQSADQRARYASSVSRVRAETP